MAGLPGRPRCLCPPQPSASSPSAVEGGAAAHQGRPARGPGRDGMDGFLANFTISIIAVRQFLCIAIPLSVQKKRATKLIMVLTSLFSNRPLPGQGPCAPTRRAGSTSSDQALLLGNLAAGSVTRQTQHVAKARAEKITSYQMKPIK